MSSITINIAEISVPLESSLYVTEGPVDLDVVLELENRRFDQAPIVSDRVCIGIAPTPFLRRLAEQKEHLSCNAPEVDRDIYVFQSRIPLQNLLELLSEKRAVLIAEENGKIGANVMVTISDLNRHAVRNALYVPLSEIESRLATLIEEKLGGDGNLFLQHLGERDQISLLGQYHFLQRNGVEISLLAGATLTQLLKIAGKKDTICKTLGYEKKSIFEKETGSIPDLRNKVMHPVRPLIHKQEEVSKLMETVDKLEKLRDRLRKAFESLSVVPQL